LREVLARCHDDPGRFNHVILGGSPFWCRQEEASQLVAKHHTVVLPWGNALGKSFWAARMGLWWICTRPGSECVTTAPSFDQLDSVLWKNIRQAVATSRYPLGIELTRKPLKAKLGEGWEISGIATTKTERISGRHNANLLALIDETSGVESAIMDGIDSLIPAKVVEIGNPLKYDGRFREDFDEARKQAGDLTIPSHERTVALSVPSTESPDIHLDDSPRGMACGSWLRRMARKYGQHSLWWKTHVLAQFPDAAFAGLIPAPWFDLCNDLALLQALRSTQSGGIPCLSCDLGEGTGRDSTTILARDNLGVLEVFDSNVTDLDDAADEFVRIARKWQVPAERTSFDSGGMIGKQFRRKLDARGFEASYAYKGNNSGGSDFTNLRTACAFALRMRLDPAGTYDPRTRTTTFTPFTIPPGPWWPMLREEVLALKYDLLGKKTRLEPKVDLCETLGRSPDRADALMQSFWREALQRIE